MRQALAGLAVGAVVAAFGWASAAQAAPFIPYTSQSAFESANPGYSYQSFSSTSVNPGSGNTGHYSAPVTIGTVTYDSVFNPFIGPTDIFESIAGGVGSFNNLAFGVNTPGDAFILTFASPVQSFATGLYTKNGSSVVITAIDSLGNSIGSDTISAAKGGDPTFFGLSGTDIKTIDIGATGTSADQVYLAGAPFAAVPEPMTILLLGTGLIGLGVVRRKAS